MKNDNSLSSLVSCEANVASQTERLYYCQPKSRSGEIGIRTRLKIWRGHTHVGSSPTSGTTLLRIAILTIAFVPTESKLNLRVYLQ